jgi:hypothetical protein
MATLIADIDDTLDQALARAAAQCGISKAEYVRNLLRTHTAPAPAAATETTAEWLARLREGFAEVGYAEDLLAQIPPRSELPREVDLPE